MSKPAQTTFTVTLRSESGVDAIRALRALLKKALRTHGLRCISATAKTHKSFATTVGADGGKRIQRAEKGKAEMDMSAFNGSSFLRVKDVEPSGPFEAVITKIEMGKFDKPNLYLSDGAVLGLNKTNNRALCRAYGTNSDAWIGQRIKLSVGESDYQGTPTKVILVEPISPPIKEKKKKVKGGDDDAEMNDRIPF